MQSDRTDCCTALTADTRGQDDNSPERHNFEVRYGIRIDSDCNTTIYKQTMLRVYIIDADVRNAIM